MSSLLIDNDTILLLAVASGTLVFIYGLYKVFRPSRANKEKLKEAAAKPVVTKLVVTSSDISAIAGDDVMATQLDLARAYVETGRHLLAKKILDHVREHGNLFQQEEAQELLKSI
jgi:FimV-like protein